MAIAASAYWRIRPSGNDANGGGYDASASAAATGSNLTWVTSAGVTTVTDSTAAAFTTGMVNASIEIAGVAQLKILTRVDASNITVTTMPPWLPANSGGAKYNWTVGAGTDYSQQDSPQVTFNGTTITATTAGVGATITITGYTVAATDVCNVLHITGGTNFTTGWYTITSVNTGAGTWTLDRNCTTGAGSGMTGRMGGGWATLATNTTANIVAGNTVYALGGASPNYTSPDYSTSFFTPVSGSSTVGYVTFSGDPATPTTNGFGGLPVVKLITNGCLFLSNNFFKLQYVLLVANVANVNGILQASTNVSNNIVEGVVYDQNGYDMGLLIGSNFATAYLLGCEIFSSAAKRTTNSQFALGLYQFGGRAIGCNIHDTIGPGVSISYMASIAHTIIAKCGGDSLTVTSDSADRGVDVHNCTIDGSTGHGIVFSSQLGLQNVRVINCIISNHTGASKNAITVSAGTQAANDRVKGVVDWNTLYNNAGNYNAISPGAHDTVLSSDPYVGQSTENYTLKLGVLGTANAFPGAAFPQHGSGQTATVQSYLYPGAAQPFVSQYIPAVNRSTVILDAEVGDYDA